MQEPWFMNRRDGLATLLISMDIEQKQLATTKVAADCGVSERTVRKWLTRLQSSASCPRQLHVHNVHRPHVALAGQPPISLLAMNNLLGNDS